jgi:hypothetical protein
LSAISFAPSQKSHRLQINELDLFQIYHDPVALSFGCEESLQLDHLIRVDAAN